MSANFTSQAARAGQAGVQTKIKVKVNGQGQGLVSPATGGLAVPCFAGIPMLAPQPNTSSGSRTLVPPPIPIPADARDWLHGVFAGCNDRVASTITQVPTTHEVPLDMTFIQHFLGVSAPRRFASGWTVEIRTHYLGGGRHFAPLDDWPRRWEIADIGMLVQFRQAGRLLRSKVALLQSKRLYPDEQDLEEDVPLDYMIGFHRLAHDDDDWAEVTRPRRFGFTETSRYKALATSSSAVSRCITCCITRRRSHPRRYCR